MKKLFICFAILYCPVLSAQQTCECEKVFDEMYQKVTDNYGAYEQKVTPITKPSYDELSQKVKAKAKSIKQPKECYEALNEWIAFFKDNHMFINPQNSFSLDDPKSLIEERAKKVDSQKYKSEAEFQTYLTTNAADLTEEEGIWESEDKGYRLGIIKGSKANKFYAFMLKNKDDLWITGKNKFELEKFAPNKYNTTYFYSDFSSEKTMSKMIKNILVIENIFKFEKVSPAPKELINNDDLLNRLPDYRVEKIDSNTILLTIPPFTLQNATERIKVLVTKNGDLIRGTKNLIIDLRNNPGGDENAFNAIFPFLSTEPILRKGSKIKSTNENLILLNYELKAFQGFPEARETIEPKLRDIVLKMRTLKTPYIDGPDRTFTSQPGSRISKNVAILVNKNTASSAESVCLEAKQSKRVTLMGTYTKGAADYTEVREWGMPCYGWRFAFALGYSKRLPENPIENVGIKPDVVIPDSENDWVAYAAEYLNGLK